MAIKPYTIAVPDEALDKLSQRLSLTTFPEQLDVQDPWEVGTPVAEVKRLAKYWKEGFDWRKAEAQLNQLPNFITSVDVEGFGKIDIHFVHQVSAVKGAIPLLFSHGWPGSFLEIQKLLPLLEDGKDCPAFHVVAPSLPNFGFSSGITKRGFGVDKYGEAIHKLMIKLGYSEYVTQGGDWGFSVTRSMGLQYPQSCKASHINLVLASAPKWTKTPWLALRHALSSYSAREVDGLARTAWFDNEGYGYNMLQSTKPQTIGHALADSPVALLSWIYEKLHDWTDGYPWTDDEILTWVSIYWFSTAGPAASVRIYYEATHPQTPAHLSTATLRGWVPQVKLGLAYFPRDIRVVPKSWGRTLGPVYYESEHEAGGHFATWEVPDAIAGDLKKMFQRQGPCFDIVKNRSGY